MLTSVDKGQLKIFDLQGSLIRSQNIVKGLNQIQLADLTSGMYFLRTSNGEQAMLVVQ